MDFKCLFFSRAVRRIEKGNITLSEDFNEFNIIESKLYSNKFIAFRLQRKQSPAKYGVCEKGKKDASPLIEELEGKEMVVQDFIIIDQTNEKFSVFYSGKKEYTIEVLVALYNIPVSIIISEVSLNDLMTISEIKITAHRYGQTTLFQDEEEFPSYAEISEIFGNNDYSDKAETKYIMNKKNHSFKKEKLKELIDKNVGNELKKFTFEGLDKNGNAINYSDGNFAKKVSIFEKESYKTFNERNALKLEKLKNAIKKVITSA